MNKYLIKNTRNRRIYDSITLTITMYSTIWLIVTLWCGVLAISKQLSTTGSIDEQHAMIRDLAFVSIVWIIMLCFWWLIYKTIKSMLVVDSDFKLLELSFNRRDFQKMMLLSFLLPLILYGAFYAYDTFASIYVMWIVFLGILHVACKIYDYKYIKYLDVAGNDPTNDDIVILHHERDTSRKKGSEDDA